MVFCGGVGSGKTHIGSRFAWRMMRNYPKALGLITANTYAQLHQSTLKPFLDFLRSIKARFVFNREPIWFQSRFKEHSNVLSFWNGAQVVCRSLENYDDLRGQEFGWWWGDETRDTKQEAFEVVLGRMRDKNGPRLVRLTTTPKGYDWLHTVFVEEPDSKPELRFQRQLINATIYGNRRNLPPGYIETLEATLSPEMARQELLGQFINIKVGQAYSCFSRKDHVINDTRTAYNSNQPLVLACDFNVSPMAWVVGQRRDNGTFAAIAEIWRETANAGESAVQSAAREFVKRFGKHASGITVFGDASGDNEHSATTETNYKVLAAELTRGGVRNFKFSIPTVNPPVVDRVGFVNGALRNVKGEIRLFIHPTCAKLTRDLERVVWRKTGDLDQVSDKTLTHISDALGYWLMQALRPARTKPGAGNTSGGISFDGYE